MKKLIVFLFALLSANIVWALDATDFPVTPSLVENGVVNESVDEQNEPHESGCWMVLRDRFNREVWYQLERIDWGDGLVDYITSIALHYSLYGGFDPATVGMDPDARPKVPCYIVVDGIRYGAPSSNEEPIYGTPYENTLIESDKCYGIPVGYYYTLGFIEDKESGEKFLMVDRVNVDVFGNPADYITGDVDINARVNIDDVTAMIAYLLSGNVTPFSTSNADVDGSGRIAIEDVTATINFLLNGRW